MGVQSLQQGQGKGGRLASAGLGLAHQIAAQHQLGNGGPLNRRGILEANCRQTRKQFWAEAETRETGGIGWGGHYRSLQCPSCAGLRTRGWLGSGSQGGGGDINSAGHHPLWLDADGVSSRAGEGLSPSRRRSAPFARESLTFKATSSSAAGKVRPEEGWVKEGGLRGPVILQRRHAATLGGRRLSRAALP